MPELPEVEICRRQLASRLTDAVITRIEAVDPKFRLPRTWAGRRIQSITRRAKYIVVRLDAPHLILIHLGMTGWFEFEPPSHYRLAMHTNKGSAWLEDPRRFARVRVVTGDQLRQVLEPLGPEPLTDGFRLDDQLATRRPIKVALLDQHLVAGIGNIYASESLWRARIHPAQPANSLKLPARRRLQRAIVAALTKGISYGDEIFTAPNQFHVYGREGQACHRCRQTIARMVQSGRSTFWCPQCQAADPIT